jgi:hypothetical protein
MSDPISRILRTYPSEFFRQMLEYADAGFAEAHTLASRHSEEPERANILGQLRHARCEAGFRRAASENGLAVVAPHTQPRGGRYSLVKGEGIYLIRSNVQKHCGPPRPTAFRKQWATLNSWLSPLQLSLLESVTPPQADRLCGMLVTTAHPRSGDPSVPSFVGVGIPRADLSDWVRLISVSDLLALYHEADAAARKPPEAPIDIKDKAVPRLKKKRSDGEG